MNANNFSVMHDAGVEFAQIVAAFFVGFSIGRHIVKVIRNKIRGAVAVANVIRDTAISFGVGYIIGALIDAGGQTATVKAVSNVVSSSAVGKIFSGAAASVIKTICAAFSEIGGIFANVTAGTALSGAVFTVVGTIGAAGLALGAAIISAAPFVILGVIVGGIFAVIFDK